MKSLMATIIALAFLTTGLAFGQKFENKDTAEDRYDRSWGTRKTDDSGGYIGTDERGNDSWGTKAREPEPERDWYDSVIITVSPDTGYGTKTTTEVNTNSTGDVTNSTETTTTYD